MIISSGCSGDGRLGQHGGSAEVCRGDPGERHHLRTARPPAPWSPPPHRKRVDCLRRQTCKQCLTMINVVEKARKCLLALSSSLLHHLSLASKGLFTNDVGFLGVSDTPWCLCQPIISFWHAP